MSTNPKDPGMSQERDYAYIPILRMGLEPKTSSSREGSGSLGKMLIRHLGYWKHMKKDVPQDSNTDSINSKRP